LLKITESSQSQKLIPAVIRRNTRWFTEITIDNKRIYCIYSPV